MTRLSFWVPALIGFGIPTPSLAQPTGPYMYGQPMWENGWHLWFFGTLMMIAFVAIAAILIVLLIRWLGPSGNHVPHRAPARTPLDILKERYARGEIEKEEFEERRQVLGE